MLTNDELLLLIKNITLASESNEIESDFAIDLIFDHIKDNIMHLQKQIKKR